MLVQHSSVTTQHYTPKEYVEAARKVLEFIDLDPASCEQAQYHTVNAACWYGPGSPHGEDGLALPWNGTVFLNPPGGRAQRKGLGTNSDAALWWSRLALFHEANKVTSAIFLGFTVEILRSAQMLEHVPQPIDFPFCVPRARIPFDTINVIRKKGKRAGELINPSQPAGAIVSGKDPAHANVIVYLPPLEERLNSIARFGEVFSQFGRCRLL